MPRYQRRTNRQTKTTTMNSDRHSASARTITQCRGQMGATPWDEHTVLQLLFSRPAMIACKISLIFDGFESNRHTQQTRYLRRTGYRRNMRFTGRTWPYFIGNLADSLNFGWPSRKGAECSGLLCVANNFSKLHGSARRKWASNTGYPLERRELVTKYTLLHRRGNEPNCY